MTHIRDGHRDDGVDRMSAVLRGKLAPIRRMVEVQEGKVVLLKRFAHSSYRIKAIAPAWSRSVDPSSHQDEKRAIVRSANTRFGCIVGHSEGDSDWYALTPFLAVNPLFVRDACTR